MTPKPKSSQPDSPKPDSLNSLHEQIRERAFQLYEQRGGIDGFALDDWLSAESEILAAQKPRKVRAAKGSK